MISVILEDLSKYQWLTDKPGLKKRYVIAYCIGYADAAAGILLIHNDNDYQNPVRLWSENENIDLPLEIFNSGKYKKLPGGRAASTQCKYPHQISNITESELFINVPNAESLISNSELISLYIEDDALLMTILQEIGEDRVSRSE